jgi:hypothetical protein
MLVSFFKNNNPISYILLPVLAVLCWVSVFFTPVMAPDSGMALYSAMVNWLGASSVISTIVALFILIIEAFLINYIVNENEILSKQSFLPALFYILFMSCDTSFLSLNPLLLANFFILLAVHQLVNSYRKDTAFSNAFDAGLLLALATLFYFPSVVFFPLIYIGFLLFRPFVWREWLIAFIGFIVPYTFVFAYYFWNDMLSNLLSVRLLYPHPTGAVVTTSSGYYFMISVCLFILALSVAKLLTGYSDGPQKNRKGVTLLLWLSAFALLSLFLSPLISIKSFALLSIPAAVFSANYFLKLKRSAWGELLLILFLIAIFVNHFSDLV